MEYRNILVFSFSFIGDAVLSTAVIDPLRRRHPRATLSFLVGPASQPVLQGDLHIDQVLVYDKQDQHRGVVGRVRLVRELRRHQFDLVVDLKDSFWSHWIGGVRWGMTDRRRRTHAVTRYLSALKGPKIQTDGAQPRLSPTARELAWVDEFLTEGRGAYRIAVHPGGNWPYKRWATQAFAALIERLNAAFDAEIVLISGPGEAEIARAVLERLKFEPLVLNKNTLREVAALLSRCDHYIGNDTGPMHIAAAVGTPVTALFASTDHRRSGPYGEQHRVVLGEKDLGCQPCHPGRAPGRCGRGFCEVLDSIPVDKVFQIVCEQIESQGSGGSSH